MAHPIRNVQSLTVSTEEQRLNSASHLQQALADNGESIEKLISIARLMDDRGVLAVLTAVLEQAEPLLKILVDRAGTPGGVSLLKNGIALVQAMGEMDPQGILALSRTLTALTEAASDPSIQPVGGIFDLLKAVRDPEVGKGISVVMTALKTLGAGTEGETAGES